MMDSTCSMSKCDVVGIFGPEFTVGDLNMQHRPVVDEPNSCIFSCI